MNNVFGPKVLPQDSPAIPLLEKNDTGRGIYISHINRTPLGTKFFAFGIMLLMYAVLSIIMVWRASKNYNVVLALLLNDFHYVETGVLNRLKGGFWSWCWTLMVASFDYYLLRFFWPPVRMFITDHLWFRLRFGFHETEVVFRAPTGREYDDMLQLPPETAQRVWQMSIMKATNDPFVLGNDGFTALSPPWELCCTASMDAHRLAKNGGFDLKNWELSVWQKDEYQRWTVWETWRHQDPSLSVMAIDIMKEKLKAEGKETLVARLEAMLVQQASGTRGIGPGREVDRGHYRGGSGPQSTSATAMLMDYLQRHVNETLRYPFKLLRCRCCIQRIEYNVSSIPEHDYMFLFFICCYFFPMNSQWKPSNDISMVCTHRYYLPVPLCSATIHLEFTPFLGLDTIRPLQVSLDHERTHDGFCNKNPKNHLGQKGHQAERDIPHPHVLIAPSKPGDVRYRGPHEGLTPPPPLERKPCVGIRPCHLKAPNQTVRAVSNTQTHKRQYECSLRHRATL